MTDLTLKDLHNPTEINSICIRRGKMSPDVYFVEPEHNQGFQERPGSIELWEMVDGRLLRVKRWLKKSIVATAGKAA